MSVIFINPYIAFPPSGLVLPALGDPFEGGFLAGLISHSADGNPTHALIVAPRATGASGTGYTLTTSKTWKTTTTTTANTSSTFDGAANTAAMVAAGIADHPAAQFCVGLSIGDFNDWYLPALLELDIIYYNLKPTTTSNSTSVGVNAYAVPPRTTNYTTSDPAQTSVAAFQTGGNESFQAFSHWVSTQNTSANAANLTFDSGGHLNAIQKTVARRVRAIRKIAL